MSSKNLIQLVPLTSKRIDDYLRWFNDEEVRKYLLPTSPRTKKEISNWINKITKNRVSRYFSIFLPLRKIFIGHVGFKNIDSINKKAEIGIVIGEKSYWRKGFGVKAVLEILASAKTLGLKEIYAKIQKENLASIKFFSKLGFSPIVKPEENSVILEYRL